VKSSGELVDQPSRRGFGRRTSAFTGFARADAGVMTTPHATARISTSCGRVHERRCPSSPSPALAGFVESFGLMALIQPIEQGAAKYAHIAREAGRGGFARYPR
jgi:hypothetical protein